LDITLCPKSYAFTPKPTGKCAKIGMNLVQDLAQWLDRLTYLPS